MVKCQLTNGDKQVGWEHAEVIGVSPTGRTERSKGLTDLRFLLHGTEALALEPYDSVAEWLVDNEVVTLTIEGFEESIPGCRIRECSLEISLSRLYITLYVPVQPQHVRHWFIPELA